MNSAYDFQVKTIPCTWALAYPNKILFTDQKMIFRSKLDLAKLELVPMGNISNVDGLGSILACKVFGMV